MSTTRAQLLLDLSRDLFRNGWESFTALDNADSSTSVVPIAQIRHGNTSTQKYVGSWVYIYAGTEAGEERQVVAYNPTKAATYGTISVQRPFDAALDTTSQGVIYPGPLSPTDLIRLINRALRRLRRQRTLPLTLVADGLMESTGTTAWTASNAMLAKVATTATVSEGAQALSVTNSGVDGEAQSTTIPVNPGEHVFVEAAVRVGNTSGSHTATLVAYDATNGAAITSESTSHRARTPLSLDFHIPNDCTELQFRLRGSAADTVAYWDEVIAWRPEDRQFALPADVEAFDQPLAVYERITRNDNSAAASPRSVEYRLLGSARVLADPTAATPYLLDIARVGWNPHNPLLVECLLPYPELETDTATTLADPDKVLLRARGLAFAMLAKEGPHEDRKKYEAWAREVGAAVAGDITRQPRPARPISPRRASPRGRIWFR